MEVKEDFNLPQTSYKAFFPNFQLTPTNIQWMIGNMFQEIFYYEIRKVHVEHLYSDYPQIILLTYNNEKIILEYSKGFILEFESHLNYILDSIFED